GTLTDHLVWQLGSLSLAPVIRDTAEYIIGNLNEDGYLTATDEELLEGYLREQLQPENGQDTGQLQIADIPEALAERARVHLTSALKVVQNLDPVGIATRDLRECLLVQIDAQQREFELIYERQKRSTAYVNGSSNAETAESLLNDE